MQVIQSHLNTRSEEFQQNREDMLELLAYLDVLHQEAAEGGGEEAWNAIHNVGPACL